LHLFKQSYLIHQYQSEIKRVKHLEDRIYDQVSPII
jgi:hypothetical protein